uniref:Palmitoyltransferase n=1 Tax=Eptatretus burgeri TaxID=7764 RepID=A0A8C4PYP9_EPTBU
MVGGNMLSYLPLCFSALLAVTVGAEVLMLVLNQHSSTDRYLQLTLFVALSVNLMGNVCQFVRNDPSIRGVFLHPVYAHGWRFCDQCETQVPPRSAHCFACDVCVLRRDHHCTFLSTCVGFANYRYFMGGLATLWACLLFSVIVNGRIMGILLLRDGLGLRSLFCFLVPWLMWFIGQLDSASFVFAFIADTCVAALLFVSVLLLLHVWLLVHGQTATEWRRGDWGTQRSILYMLRSWLGHRWYLVGLSPFIRSEVPGNGTEPGVPVPSPQLLQSQGSKEL